MSAPFRYRVFGLAIASELALPASAATDSDSEADVTIRVGPLLDPPPESGAVRLSRALQIQFCSPDHWLLFAYGLDTRERCSVSVRPSDIEVGWNAGVEVDDITRHLLLGVAMAARAFIAGRICLHGSAVRIGERTLAIMGDSGRGKSTLITALVKQGAELVTEEFILSGSRTGTVVSGVSAVKISHETAAAFGMSDLTRTAFAHRSHADEGLLFEAKTSPYLSGHEFPIDEVYLLGPRHAGAAPLLSPPLMAAEAAVALAESGYWMPYLPRPMQQRVIRAAFEMTLMCSVRRLQMPDGLHAVPRAAGLLRQWIIEKQAAFTV